VGVLKTEEAADARVPAALAALLKHFPFCVAIPITMTVHFPIVFMFSSTVFSLLYLITGEKSFDTTGVSLSGRRGFFQPDSRSRRASTPGG